MNKKTILSVLAILITICLILTGCGKNKEDENKETAKLVDEYAPFEFTIKYPKDAGYKFEADLENTPYVAGKLINEERNIKISFNFSLKFDTSVSLKYVLVGLNLSIKYSCSPKILYPFLSFNQIPNFQFGNSFK